MLGQNGTVVAILRPAGQVEIAGERRGAVSEHGDYLPEGTQVTVVGVRFNDLVVRKLG
jgi:membrane-bound ClpP family serine protease